MKMTYEEAFDEMEKIVKDMESDTISLDETLVKYKRATELYKYLKKYLDDFEKEVKEITEDGIINFDDSIIESEQENQE